jgi:hypothetical protein
MTLAEGRLDKGRRAPPGRATVAVIPPSYTEYSPMPA